MSGPRARRSGSAGPARSARQRAIAFEPSLSDLAAALPLACAIADGLDLLRRFLFEADLRAVRVEGGDDLVELHLHRRTLDVALVLDDEHEDERGERDAEPEVDPLLRESEATPRDDVEADERERQAEGPWAREHLHDPAGERGERLLHHGVCCTFPACQAGAVRASRTAG